MGKGNTANKPCWCGSGKKYKKCHGSNIQINKVKPSNMDLDLQKELKKDVCYAPHEYHTECDSIMSAHSISKSKHLKLIANEKGYLYELKINSGISHTHGKRIVNKISIKKSSTFYGFCSKHDKELFEPIDNEFILDNKQIFLNLYRTISKELYKKKNILNHQINNMPGYSIGLDSLHAQVYKPYLEKMTYFTKIAIRDLESLKHKLDLELIEKSFSKMKYYALIINKIPEIMNTFPWNVTIDVKNNKLIDIHDISKIYNFMTVSSFVYQSDKGIILFSWLDELDSDECFEFIREFNKLSHIDKVKAFLKLSFVENEDIYFSQEWWDNLTDNQKETLINLINETINFNNCEQLDVVNWKIIEIKHNINLEII
ncbi:MAG: hypothetical protein H6Q35_124 [Proteobacteria bacterium]|nr:hypothetical protein [Pseudomonadota bacterium]